MQVAAEPSARAVREEPADKAAGQSRFSWPRWALAASLILAFGFYALALHRYFEWEYARSHLDIWQAQVQQHLLLALLLVFGVYLAATALSLPVAAVLTLLAGALFGRWLGTGVVSLASTLGATLAFLGSRYLFRDWVQRHFGERLHVLNEGVAKDGAYYLFTLRLVPAFPFFLVNLGMGLTPLRVRTFFWVSLLGMLPGTFLYVNAGKALGSIDSARDILSPGVLVSLALLGVVPLAIRKLVQWKVRLRTVARSTAALLVLAVAGLGVRTYFRYWTAEIMEVPVTEYRNEEYPEDPAIRSLHFGQYNGRRLTLVQKDDTHFDFVLEPTHPHVARIVFRDIDVSLLTPSLPAWAKEDTVLTRIALTDRQWNRQQVSFEPKPPHVEVSGGNRFEKGLFDQGLLSAELAKNCLNAGLWEVLLFEKDKDGNKAQYYHGWFTFPLGHYKRIFEHNTGLLYWKHWYYLEHWFDPAGNSVRLDGLRRVVSEREVPVRYDPDEPVAVAGEQVRKRRTTLVENILTWKDFYDGRKVRFGQFIPPGRYSVGHLWKNEYWRLSHFEKGILREITSPATGKPLHELELVFIGKDGGNCRFLVSGLDLAALPLLPVQEYPKGLYLPMGIGVPPFFQGYDELTKNPPDKSPYFCMMLDSTDRWINHHDVAVDGPVMHRDANAPDLLHVYLLSYERHSLIGHFVVSTPFSVTGPGK
jgi:uncharacterized membrane protein YdjX (TVP38/TMEM64 family)